MEAPSILRRHRWLRWTAPAAVLTLAGLTATGAFTSDPTSAHLPATSPTALIASVRSANVTGYSGTVVSRVSLGLPELPTLGNTDSGASFSSLLTGSHTLQVWYGGAEEQRVAVLGPADETDVFRSGRSVWQWTSASRVATHVLLPQAGRGPSDAITGIVGPHTGAAALTPGGLAARVMHAIEPSTEVQVRRGTVVADRSAYQLVLTPRDPATLIGSVRISIDGATKVPLGVQIYPRGSSSAAVDVAYTSISFGRPSRSMFRFAPPSGATVREVPVHAPVSRGAALPDLHALARRAMGSSRFVTAGSAWTSVVGYHVNARPGARSPLDVAPHGLLAHALVPVSGSWGRGRLLQSSLVNVLLTRDGWVFAGAVDPPGLYAAAAAR